jgi:hypothetical protein
VDLVFFSGGALVTPLFYLFWQFISQKLGSVEQGTFFSGLLFLSIFDFPHVFQTFSRSHGVEIKNQIRWVNISIFLSVILTYGLYYGGGKNVFYSLFGIFGTWHIVRQNLGLLKLYYYKNKISKNLLNLGFEVFVFYATFILYSFFDMSEWQSFSRFFSTFYLEIIPLLINVTACIVLVVVLCLLFQSLLRVCNKNFKSLPKDLFFFSFLIQACFLAWAKVPAIIFVALGTIQHDLQYQAFTRRYQKRILGSKKSIQWLFYSLTWGLAYFLIELLDRYKVWHYSHVLVPLFLSVTLWHYWVDGFIWKFSDSKELTEVFEI